jgi:hypothetical protein
VLSIGVVDDASGATFAADDDDDDDATPFRRRRVRRTAQTIATTSSCSRQKPPAPIAIHAYVGSAPNSESLSTPAAAVGVGNGVASSVIVVDVVSPVGADKDDVVAVVVSVC